MRDIRCILGKLLLFVGLTFFAAIAMAQEYSIPFFSLASSGSSSSEEYTLLKSAVGAQGGVKVAGDGFALSPGYIAVAEMVPFVTIVRSNTFVIIHWDRLDGVLQEASNITSTNWFAVFAASNSPVVLPTSVGQQRFFRVVR